MNYPNTLESLGAVHVTPAAQAALDARGQSRLAALMVAAHAAAGPGIRPPENAALAREAMRRGSYRASAHALPGGIQLWVITEGDRSATTVLLPTDD